MQEIRPNVSSDVPIDEQIICQENRKSIQGLHELKQRFSKINWGQENLVLKHEGKLSMLLSYVFGDEILTQIIEELNIKAKRSYTF